MSDVAPFRKDLDYSYETGAYEGVSDDERRKRAIPITKGAIELGLAFLRDSSAPHAAWKSRRVWLEKYEKTVRARAYMGTKGKSQKEREHKAMQNKDLIQLYEDLEEAMYHETLLSNLRNAAESKLSGWQTLNANARQGLVL